MKRILTALALAAASACAATSSPTTPTTTTTTTTPTTDTFSGTIAQLGSATNVFTVSAAGNVQISLTSVAPLATMALGVGIMTSDGTSCVSTISQNDNARTGGTALQGIAAPGSYCIRVYDSGNIPADSSVDYAVQVVHP